MKGMSGVYSKHQVMRALSVACLLVPVVASLLWPGEMPSTDAAVYSGLAASLILIMQPVAGEGAGLWLISSGLLASVEVLFFVTLFRPALYLAVCMSLALTCDFLRLLGRLSILRTLFVPQSVWHSLEAGSRSMFCSCACLMVLPAVAFKGIIWATAPLALMSVVFYVLMYYRSVTGRCLVISPDRERVLKQMIRCAPDISSEAVKGEDQDEMEKMQDLFDRISRIMEKDRPFLNATYSLQDMANAAFTNKTYVSKTVNTVSGKNFRQFVNGYRVQYSVELLQQNPRLTVGQLADRSGFNSSVTFTMAFKLNMGETPGEYLIRHRSGLV